MSENSKTFWSAVAAHLNIDPAIFGDNNGTPQAAPAAAAPAPDSNNSRDFWKNVQALTGVKLDIAHAAPVQQSRPEGEHMGFGITAMADPKSELHKATAGYPLLAEINRKYLTS